MKLNLAKMKKISGDEKSSTFQHEDGHKIIIAHSALPALQQKQLKALPLCSGGSIQKFAGDDNPADSYVSNVPDVSSGVDYGQNSTPVGDDYTPPNLSSLDTVAMQDLPTAINRDNTPIDSAAQSAAQDSGIGSQSSSPVAPASIPDQNPAPKESAVPAAPGTSVKAPSMPDASAAVALGQKAIREQQDVESQQAKANVGIEQSDVDARKQLMDGFNQNTKDFQDHQQQFMQDYMNNKINPNHYVQNMSTGQKVATGIGLFLGGLSTPYTHQGNPAMDFLNKQIDRDIEGQQSRLGQQKTVLEANQNLYHDQVLANNATRMNMNDIYNHQIQLAASKLGTPQAKAKADMASAQFQIQNNQLLQQNALRATVLHSMGQGGQGLDAIDLSHAGMMSPEQAEKEQASVDAQKNSIQQVNDIYSRMNKDQTLLNLANPQARARVEAYKAQLTNAVVGASASKRLTPESAKLEIEPVLSSGWHDQKTRDTQQQTVLNMIQHHADPTPMLQKYAPKSLPTYQTAPQGPKAGDTIFVRGQKAQVLDNKGNYKLVK